MVEKTEYFIHSANGINEIHVIRWSPMERIRAILQISHGMCEHADRYDEFATFMAGKGVLVIAGDHLGHGESVSDIDELGYFAVKGSASAVLVEDMRRINQMAREEYPDVPFFLLGHSMGSFLARRYMVSVIDLPDGVILSGTGNQPAAALKVGKALAAAIAKVKSDHYRSKELRNMAFSTYNKRIKPARTEFDWLSVNADIVDSYAVDPRCGFTFTVNGFRMLFDLIEFIQNEHNLSYLHKELPVFMIYGSEDPVGHYGADIAALRRTYKKAGMKRIAVRSYEGDRHEILSGMNKGKVRDDLFAFMNKAVGRRIF